MSGTIVRASGLTKSYRRGPEEVHALRGVDFELGPGEVVALVGPSGSGKTTLLNLLVGWEHPDRGDIVWSWDGDKPVSDRLWDELAILPQRLGLIEELTVRENVMLPLRLGRHPASPYRTEELLDALGL
ncbi:MAG: ATP-binding cassette domain-containing protein, partial [Actinomycetota bacterium]